MKNGFFRGHGLGNDYVVMDPKELSFSLTPSRIKVICDRNWGLGSDGILALVPSKKADFGLRIFNPDGSEAEKSGNGLRIFARYLHATGKTKKKHFTVETKGGLVTIDLHVDRHGDASAVTVEMGRAMFQPAALPCTLTVDELIEQPIEAAGQSLTFSGVSVGNPHVVIPVDDVDAFPLTTQGPLLEHHSWFPERANVEITTVLDRHRLRMRVWERGVGETPACGSGACAAAVAAVATGVADSPVTVMLPGGELVIEVGEDGSVTMHGPAERIECFALPPTIAALLA